MGAEAGIPPPLDDAGVAMLLARALVMRDVRRDGLLERGVTGEGIGVERTGVAGCTMGDEEDRPGLGVVVVTEEIDTEGKVILFADENELDREWAWR
jgi:hypothetical protein